MEGLNELERAVLEKLLAGDHPLLVVLRSQAAMARLAAREYTGAGFFCSFEVPSGAPALARYKNFHFGDVDADVDGLEHGVGFVLFIRDGRLATLEGYCYEEPWPREIRNFTLRYQREPRELKLPDPLPDLLRS